jgi:hypothetical protein
MAENAGQHVLQTALSSGLSATEGIHSKSKHGVDPSFDGQKQLLPETFIPKNDIRVTFRGKNGNVEMPLISWGSWSWGRLTLPVARQMLTRHR